MKKFIMFLTILSLLGCAFDVHDGRDGKSGRPGQDGSDGSDGSDGEDGDDGQDGAPGLPGTPGSSCSVTNVSNGALITCDNGSSALIVNGTDGTNGVSPVLEVVTLCPTSHEVLFRLVEGLYGHYSHGNQQYLRRIDPGNWVTTDGTSCYFTIHPDLSVTW